MSLDVHVALSRGSLALDAAFVVAPDETVALVGPNGAGKTSCLLAIAGLLRLDGGRIALGDRVFDGGPAGPWLEPERRDVGVVFQEPLLFPGMSVRDNVAYGPRARGAGKRTARAVAAAWLERVGLGDLGDARPAALSGGQAQRVALARALASSPRVLLLDEPFAAVDASAKLALRRELREHLAAFEGPRLVVVHDVGDALALAQRVVVLEGGRVVQTGGIGELVGRPRSRYVADLLGVNCFRGICRNGAVALGGVELVVASAEEGPVLLTVHPRAVALFRDRPAGSPRNVWRAPVVGLETQLDRVRVQLGGGLAIVAEVTPAAVRDLGLGEGSEVWVALKATEIHVAAQ